MKGVKDESGRYHINGIGSMDLAFNKDDKPDKDCFRFDQVNANKGEGNKEEGASQQDEN